MFSTVYRVTRKDFYARPYTSMWAPVVARQIPKTTFTLLPRVHQHARCYTLNRFNNTLSQISQISNFSPIHNVLNAKTSDGVKSGDLGGQAVGPSAYNTSHDDKNVARA